jgi:hypothetical protein
MPTFAKRDTLRVAVSISAFVSALLFLSYCAKVTAAPAPIFVTMSPLFRLIETSGSQGFTAVVLNDSQNKGVNWTLSGTGCSDVTCGTLSAISSASGAPITYTAPAVLPSSSEVTLTATSVADSTKSAAATIILTSQDLSVTVSPNASSVELDQKLRFTATVTNNSEEKAGVIWRLRGTGCGGRSCGRLSSIFSKSGDSITYTAPDNLPQPANVTLTAISVADFTKSAAATITVTPAPGAIVAIASATSASVPAGTSQNFTATVQNDSQNNGVTWMLLGASCSEGLCGSVSNSSSASGVAIIYTAPAVKPDPSAIILQGTSVTDSTKSVTIDITIM